MMDYAKEYDRIVEQSNKQIERIKELERENAELRKQLQAEHERQARVWTEIQSQYRDHSPLSLTVEFDNGYRK